jgi:hypothetical protein
MSGRGTKALADGLIGFLSHSEHQMTETQRDPRSKLQATSAETERAEHDEWLLDESIEETFPASDATLPIRPGSSLSRRNQSRSSGDA